MKDRDPHDTANILKKIILVDDKENVDEFNGIGNFRDCTLSVVLIEVSKTSQYDKNEEYKKSKYAAV